MTGLPVSKPESEATQGHFLKVFLQELEAKGQIISYVHIPNEGKRKYEERRNQARQGLRKGASDYDIKLDIRYYVVASVAIEIKTTNGKLSPEQARYLNLVNKPEAGHMGYVVYAHTGQECVEKVGVILNNLIRERAPQGS